MKRLKCMIIFSVVLLFSVINIYAGYNSKDAVDLTLANIKALANDEGSGTGQYFIDQAITQYFRDGTLYKESKVIDCLKGGSNACSSGKYYRYKKSDGTWDNWIPA